MFRQREGEEEEEGEEAAEGRSHLQTRNYNMTVQSTVLTITFISLQFLSSALLENTEIIGLIHVLESKLV